MTHSWDPDGSAGDGATRADGADDRADADAATESGPGGAAPDGEQPRQEERPATYSRPSFGTGGQFPIPPPAWRDADPASGPQPDAPQPDAPHSGAPARGVTSGAPLPPGPFFASGAERPTPDEPADQGTFTDWTPPPRVDWRPEPAPTRIGRRRRNRHDDEPGQPFFASEARPAYPSSPPPQSPPPQYLPPQGPPVADYPPPVPADQPPQGWVAHPTAPQQEPAQQQPTAAPQYQQPAAQSAPLPTPQAQPARQPRPEDLLAPNVRPTDAEPASWGWRGRLNRGSGGLIKPKASPEELAVRSAVERIQYGFSRPMTVVVVQPKGGAGKTPTTICLASAFGAYRGGYVVGWDDNETRGTLAVRVTNSGSQTSTVWDLLSDLDGFERTDARVGDLGYYVRAQPDAHFDALVSDDNPGNMSQIGEGEFHRLHRVLGRFYRMIVVDTGNNVRSPNWQAAVNAADLVVVVSSYQRDVGYSGSWVLDHLAQTGREELARNAVTVLTAADPTTDKAVRAQLVEHFRSRTRAVAEIPYDPALAHGGPIRWTEMTQATRNAWTLAAATVVEALAEHDERR